MSTATRQATTATLEETLERYFDFQSFRPGQRDIVKSVLEGTPVLAVMPTGAGKSLCYQLPALLQSGSTLVVSPLIALMKDQVDALRQRGIEATYINSQLSSMERTQRAEDMERGRYRLIYVAPERFRDELFVTHLKRTDIATLAVDEAHCVSQWGHDFRPDYRRLAEVVERLDIPQITAFTATATPEVRDDIVEGLGLSSPKIFIHGFARENLHLRVVPVKKLNHKIDIIINLLHHEPTASGIIYVSTRKNALKVAEALRNARIASDIYHGGLSEKSRNRAQEKFMRGKVRVMVATNAFGMGIDKPDLRFVIHHDMPGSLEAYYQEAGRAGRDGLPSECILLFNYVDARVHEFFIDRIGEPEDFSGATKTPPSPQTIQRLQNLERAKLRRMLDYCYANLCRHHLILNYFGETLSAELCGQRCDLCDEREKRRAPEWTIPSTIVEPKKKIAAVKKAQTPRRKPTEDEIVLLQKILSAVARSRGRLSVSGLVSLVRGTGKKLPGDLLESKSMGILRQERTTYLSQILDDLLRVGALRFGVGAHRRPILTSLGIDVMKRVQGIELHFPEKSLDPEDVPRDCDESLYELLVEKRRLLAGRDSVPPYVVAHNKVLMHLAHKKPTSLESMLAIKGIGPARAERYGEEFLGTIRLFAQK